MVVLYILLGIIGFVTLLLLLAFIFKPHLLILPYSFTVRLLVRNKPFVDKDKYFPNAKILEDNWQKVRDELLDVLRIESAIPKFHEVDRIQGLISARDEVPWRTYGLRAFDNWIESNCARAPFTTSLLKQMPEVSLAMFSILDPGKRIPPHFGFNKTVYRYHLALIVPTEGDCWIKVGGETYRWKEGQGVLFDDTFNHEVWNNTPQRRAVLFLDVSRQQDFPRWLWPVNNWLYRKLATSDKVKQGVLKAEVPLDIQPG